MILNFIPISLDRQSDYLEYFEKCPQKASDYSFANLWGWANESDRCINDVKKGWAGTQVILTKTIYVMSYEL